MIRILLCLISSFFILNLAYAESAGGDENVIYRYREFERFDFEDIVIEGETGSPGDLSIAPRFQRQFENPLPYRKNFNAEIRKAVERTR